MTQTKYQQNLRTIKNIVILKTPKNIKIHNFYPHPKNIAWAYACMKISEYPPPPPLGFECLTLLKIEVIEYGKEGFKMAWNAFSET